VFEIYVIEKIGQVFSYGEKVQIGLLKVITFFSNYFTFTLEKKVIAPRITFFT